jgi:hypothetical protein
MRRVKRGGGGGGVGLMVAAMTAAAALLLPPTATPCAAGIVVTGRESNIAASGQTSGDQFDLNDASTTLGLYDTSVNQSLPVEGGDSTSASASQRSNVTANALPDEARGEVSADIADLDAIAAQASTFLNVAFDVTDQPETLSIQGHVQSTFDGAARVRLEGTDGTLFERQLEIGDEGNLDFDESVTLAPGSYTLSAETHVTGTQSPNAAEFQFSVSSDGNGGGNGGGGGGGVFIPLPPAAFLGGKAMLLLMSPRGRRAAAKFR